MYDADVNSNYRGNSLAAPAGGAMTYVYVNSFVFVFAERSLCHQLRRYDPQCGDVPFLAPVDIVSFVASVDVVSYVAPVDDAVFAACSGQLLVAGESWMYALLSCRCPAVTADGAVASPAATGVIRRSGGSGSQNCGVAPWQLGAGRSSGVACRNGKAGCRAAPLRYCAAIGFDNGCGSTESFESCDVSVGCVGASAACV